MRKSDKDNIGMDGMDITFPESYKQKNFTQLFDSLKEEVKNDSAMDVVFLSRYMQKRVGFVMFMYDGDFDKTNFSMQEKKQIEFLKDSVLANGRLISDALRDVTTSLLTNDSEKRDKAMKSLDEDVPVFAWFEKKVNALNLKDKGLGSLQP